MVDINVTELVKIVIHFNFSGTDLNKHSKYGIISMTTLALAFKLVLIGTLALAFTGCSSLQESLRLNGSGKTIANSGFSAGEAIETDSIESANSLKPVEPETNISSAMLYQLLVAELAQQRGDIETAVKYYMEIASITKDPKAAERATQLAASSSNLQTALQAAALWVASAPEDIEARRMYTALLIKAGRAFETIPHYEKMLQLGGKDTAMVFGVIVSQLSRLSENSVALSVMEKVSENRQDDANALFAYSHLAMRQAQFDLAESTLDQVLVLKPNWPRAVTMRANLLAMKGDKDGALKYLKDILKKGELEENLDVNRTYGRMLTEFRKYEEALIQYEKLMKLVPQNTDFIYTSGVLALQLEKYKNAKTYLQKVLSRGERVYESNYYLGQIAEAQNDVTEAINYYSSVKRGRLYFTAQVRVVALFADKKDYVRAREHLHSINITNEKQKLQKTLLDGDLYREEGRYEDAMEFYTKILIEFPDLTSVRYARALIAEKLNEIALVESDLQKILQTEPSNAQVLNALGYTLADRTDRYDEALKYIQQALQIEPNDAAVMDSMGWVNYHLGNFKEAILHLKRANEIGKDPEIAAHLGEVLWVSGKKSAALEIWEDSLRDNPENDILLDVMKRFGL